MSPIFNFDPTAVSAGIEVLPKREYEFTIGKPKTFNKTNQAGNPSYGIQFPLTVTQPDGFTGKKVFFRTYFQSEGAQAAAKAFFIASYGYGKGAAEEKRFNNDFAAKDWSVDFDEGGALGEVYAGLEGQRVVGNLDTQPNQNNPEEEQQNFKGWRSIGSLAANPLKD